MTRRFKPMIKNIMRYLNIDISRYDSSMEYKRVRILRDQSISLVLDIGANIGQYASVLRTNGYAGRIISFEPLEEAFYELSQRAAVDTSWDCLKLALGSIRGPANIHVAGNSFSSSLMAMADRHRQAEPNSSYVGTQQIMVERLDLLRQQLFGPEERVYLKIDVQGYEMQVLQGAHETLKQVQALELELSVVPLYEGQPLFHEVIEHLYALGFELVSLDEAFVDPRSGYVLQLDGTFLRRRESTK